MDSLITLDEVKKYLRVDYDDDDDLITRLIDSAGDLCMDIARVDDEETFSEIPEAYTAVMYTIAYMYEHREEANHNDLAITVRNLLDGHREISF